MCFHVNTELKGLAGEKFYSVYTVCDMPLSAAHASNKLTQAGKLYPVRAQSACVLEGNRLCGTAPVSVVSLP